MPTAPETELGPSSVSVPTLATADANQAPSDCYGSKTATAGTEFARVVPPQPGRRSQVDAIWYDAGATAHTVTIMPELARVASATDAAAGQAVIVAASLPTSTQSGTVAANDWLVIKDETGAFGAYKVASISGNSITVTTSVGDASGSGFVNKILAGTAIRLMGAPADHSARQFTMKASTVTTLNNKLCTTRDNNDAILVHSNNVTNAGILTGPAYSNPAI